MLTQMSRFVVVVLAIGFSPLVVSGQTPIFEDLLTDSSKITGQWGSGIFSVDGYMLTQSSEFGGTDSYGAPRSEDYVWYDLPGVCSDGSGSVEFDISGLYPNSGIEENYLSVLCDSTGLYPATDDNDFYDSPYRYLIHKCKYDPHIDKMKLATVLHEVVYEGRSNVLSWSGTTTYRIRVTWSGMQMRWYRGLPGQTLTLLNPPTPFNFTEAFVPNILHIQLGATFRAGPRNIRDSAGTPGTLYSLFRVYEEDLGNQATPPRRPEDPVWVDLGTTDDVHYLTRVVVADGDTEPVMQGGRDCRKNVDPNSDYYFYFNVSDAFALKGWPTSDFYVMIDYYDAGTGSLTLQYDATGTIYKSGGSVTLTATNTWKQAFYHVTDAYFGNRQSGGADFRIFGGTGKTFYLDVLSVSEHSPLPAPASDPDPPHQATGVSMSADLQWAEAEKATAYDVYLGTADPPVFRSHQTGTTFDPGVMDPLTTYFWRIDTCNGFGTTTGGVWRFTTASYPGDFDEDLDVDQEDFGYFQKCYSGAGIGHQAGCEAADLAPDGDVDLEDFAVFQGCMGGAHQPPGC